MYLYLRSLRVHQQCCSYHLCLLRGKVLNTFSKILMNEVGILSQLGIELFSFIFLGTRHFWVIFGPGSKTSFKNVLIQKWPLGSQCGHTLNDSEVKLEGFLQEIQAVKPKEILRSEQQIHPQKERRATS